MGRVFEKRKYKMFARFDKMAKAFTRIGKEIAIAVKAGGPHPESNPRLRMALQSGKAANMPKDRLDAAIKRAVAKDESNYEEVVYEGYAPHGVAILVETATDNPTRTVANVRLHFNRENGALGKTGSLDFIFDRKGIFKIAKANLKMEELELDLIDFGAEEVAEDEEAFYINTSFTDFGGMQKALEEKSITILNAALQRIPKTLVELNEAQQKEVMDLVERMEEDDDVQAVYHNMKEE